MKINQFDLVVQFIK